MTMPIADQLTLSTLRIESHLANGAVAYGTAFFIDFLANKDAGTAVTALVTNKHVVEGGVRGQLYFSLSGEEGTPPTEFFNFRVDGFEAAWIPHPETDVDLCILPISPLLEHMTGMGKQPLLRTIPIELVPGQDILDGLTAIEEVIMIGYPNSLWDDRHNRPIVRRGITASHPNLDWRGRPDFLVDIACFGGSSGSPIFLFNQGSYSGADGSLVIGKRLFLLGILHSGPQVDAAGEIAYDTPPQTPLPAITTKVMMNLGIAAKAGKLRDFEPILTAKIREQTQIPNA